MAYTYSLCSWPSISFSQRSFNYQILCQSRLPLPQSTRISLQELDSEVTNNVVPNNPNLSQLKDNKKIIWVNPRSSKATQFRKKSYDSRYSSLTKVAESLNSCLPVEMHVFKILNHVLGSKLVEQDGLIILNNMLNPQTARIVLKYFLGRCNLSWKLVLYNVTLKVFRKGKDLDGAEELFGEMLQRGVTPGKAVAWFERMPKCGIQPDDAKFAVMIDAYGRVGNVEMALILYNRATIENWHIGVVTFTTVIRLYGIIRNFDGCLAVFEEMKARGIKPNLGCYNTLLDAITRAKLPMEIKSIHQEILSSNLRPGWATYAALLRAYCKARCGDDAINVYKEIRAKGMVLNTVLYNTLLSMCSDIGFVGEAVEMFEDMKRSKDCQPDSRTFSSIITMFCRYGKVAEAEATLEEMLEAGFEHDIYVLTYMIQCYGKLNQTDDVVRTLDVIMELDITPDERSCGCLLKVMTQTPREYLSKVTRCIRKANQKLGNLVKRVVELDDETFKNEASEVLAPLGADIKKAYCDYLIDLCINIQMPKKTSYFRTLL